MNRRDLLRAVAALPVVAALAPLVPKISPTARFWESAPIDMATPVTGRVNPRWLRYRLATKARSFGLISAETFAVSMGTPVDHDDGHINYFIPDPDPYAFARAEGDGVEIIPEESKDGVTWRPAKNVTVIRV